MNIEYERRYESRLQKSVYCPCSELVAREKEQLLLEIPFKAGHAVFVAGMAICSQVCTTPFHQVKTLSATNTESLQPSVGA